MPSVKEIRFAGMRIPWGQESEGLRRWAEIERVGARVGDGSEIYMGRSIPTFIKGGGWAGVTKGIGDEEELVPLCPGVGRMEAILPPAQRGGWWRMGALAGIISRIWT